MQNQSLPTSPRVFQGSFWRAFIPVTGVLFIFSLILLFRLKPVDLSLGEFLLYVLIGDLCAAGPIAFGCWYYKVDVDANGIGGYTLMNVYARLPWTAITAVRPVTLLPGIKYLRLITRSGMPVIWLPLGMKDLQGFYTAVSEYTMPDNPLRQKMETYMMTR
jgi:hypothetical protein